MSTHKKLKILLVDDESDLLETMIVMVRKWGYDPIDASTGKEALNIIRSKNPDIVILDYMMPGMDGITTLKEIRRINNTIPVIMFTAYPDFKAMKDAEKLGVSAFVPKLSVYSDTRSSLEEAIRLAVKKMGK